MPRRRQLQLVPVSIDNHRYHDYEGIHYHIADAVFNHDPHNRFENLFVARMFVVNWEMRHVHPEEQFLALQGQNTEQMRRIRRRLVNRGWTRLSQHPVRVNVDVVREFYCSASTRPNETYAIVRGVRVDYSRSFLNDYFQLPQYPCDVEYVDDDNVNVDASFNICPGAVWIADRHYNSLALPFSRMTGETEYWRRFVQFRLLPPRQSYTVSAHQLRLIYTIMTNAPIDVADIMFSEMRRVTESTREVGLPYGTFITVIAELAGVETYDNDEIIEE